jgi:peptidoglycan hydrolase CwlO-like protein
VKKRRRILTKRRLGAALAVVCMCVPLFSHAGLMEDFSKQESALNQAAEQARTLSDQVAVLNGQVTLKQQRLAAARSQAEAARTKLARLNTELTELDKQRNASLQKLEKYIRIDYLAQVPDEYAVAASRATLRQNLALFSYFGNFESMANDAMSQAADSQKALDQKREQATKQADQLIEAEDTANQEATELEAVRKSQADLLAVTQGQENTFRAQYEILRGQLEATGAFARSARNRVGSRVWDDSGFYFNQLDARWIDGKLGFSTSSTIGDYGCGLASLAMVYKYYGISTTPPVLNDKLRNTGAFVDDLLDWRHVAPASDGRLSLVGSPYPVGRANVDWNLIDSQLAGGNPVIVYVDRPGQINHYVVLIQKRGNGYLMHDPIEGPYLQFERYYQAANVVQYVTFKKNG